MRAHTFWWYLIGRNVMRFCGHRQRERHCNLKWTESQGIGFKTKNRFNFTLKMFPEYSENTFREHYESTNHMMLPVDIQNTFKFLKIPRTFRERSENTIDSVSNYKNPSICSRIDLSLKFHKKCLHKKVLSKFWSVKKLKKIDGIT